MRNGGGVEGRRGGQGEGGEGEGEEERRGGTGEGGRGEGRGEEGEKERGGKGAHHSRRTCTLTNMFLV